MTAKVLTAESAANGTALASGVTVGGDAPDIVSKIGAGNLVVSTAAGKAAHGTKSVRLTSTAGSDVALVRYSGLAGKQLGLHVYWIPDAYPATTTVICQVRHASGPIMSLQMTSAGLIQVTQTSGPPVYATTTALSTSAVTRLSLFLEVGTTTSNGRVRFATFPLGSTTAINDSGMLTGLNFGTADIASAQVGKTSAAGSAINAYFDDFRVDDEATDLLPGEGAVAAPVLTYTRSTVVRITGSATNAGVLALATDVGSPEDPVSITGPSGTGVFEVALPSPMAGDIHLTLTATNTGGTDSEAITISETGSGGTVEPPQFVAWNGSAWVIP